MNSYSTNVLYKQLNSTDNYYSIFPHGQSCARKNPRPASTVNSGHLSIKLHTLLNSMELPYNLPGAFSDTASSWQQVQSRRHFSPASRLFAFQNPPPSLRRALRRTKSRRRVPPCTSAQETRRLMKHRVSARVPTNFHARDTPPC